MGLTAPFAGKVLVTGAGGFIGRALCTRLAAAGVDYVAAVRAAAPDDSRRSAVVALGDFAAVDWQDIVQGVDAIVHLAKVYSGESHVNVGSGEDVTILELAELVAAAVGFRGRILRDPSKPDGTPRKLLDVGRLTALGWQARIALRDGIAETYAAYRRALEAGAVRLAKIASNAA